MLKLVEEEEVNIVKKEDHLDRVTTLMFDKKTAEQRDKDKLKEMAPSDEEGIRFYGI